MVVSQNYDQITMKIPLKVIRWTSLVSFPVFLLTAPNSSALASKIATCTESLISTGLGKSPAAVACADALKPQDIEDCVVQITTKTSIKANNALQSCYRVRRPDELSSCVTSISSINNELGPDISAMALNTCRRSLLPKRQAECTLNLVTIAEISSEEAIESCIAAQLTPGKLPPGELPPKVSE